MREKTTPRTNEEIDAAIARATEIAVGLDAVLNENGMHRAGLNVAVAIAQFDAARRELAAAKAKALRAAQPAERARTAQ